MNKRIKVLHLLTIIALLALIVLQAYWLFNQYVYNLQQYEDQLFAKIIGLAEKDNNLRKEKQNIGFKIFNQWRMNTSQNKLASHSPQFEWIIDVWIINQNVGSVKDYTPEQIISLPTPIEGVEKYTFEIKDSNREADIYTLIDKFQTNVLSPFSTDNFRLLIEEQQIDVISVDKEVQDSISWKAKKKEYTSIWNPIVEIIYPFNPLQKEQVRVIYKVGVSPILGRMFGSLLSSVVLSLLLIFCLIYQIRIIVKQQKIDELRRSFVKTMIHELKRPVSILKMCISFIRNEKLMQDQKMKEDIILSSQYELDNLSAYFSKLRDLTYGELEEIPLSLTTFNVKALVEESVAKQNIPTDKQVNITTHFTNEEMYIIADRMHIGNILCNLLENAIKYSGEKLLIEIEVAIVVGKCNITVSDNGFGIAPSEHHSVFDQFYRSSHITNENIPGIGFGLCYVNLLVKAHKGKISLQSELGKGSKFTIEIPDKQ